MQPIWTPNGVFLPVFTHPQTGQKWTYDPIDPSCSLYNSVPTLETRPAQASPTRTQLSAEPPKLKSDNGGSRALKSTGGTSQLQDKSETAVERHSRPPRSSVTSRSRRACPSSVASVASTTKKNSVASTTKQSGVASATKQSMTEDRDGSELERERRRRRQAERQVECLEWHRRNDAQRLRLLEPLRPWGRRGWGEEGACEQCL